MRALIVAVDYSGELNVCLPRNRPHFSEVVVVTSQADAANVIPIAEASGACVYVTDAFYANGATFNKWAALEEGLDFMGREGFLTLMDADVILPACASDFWPTMKPRTLHGAFRRMAPWPLPLAPDPACDVCGGRGRVETTDKDGRRNERYRTFDPCPAACSIPLVPAEGDWPRYPRHPNVAEIAGYLQCFHAGDPHLGPPPWHQTDWSHAGGADSFFMAKWPPEYRTRFPFEVLHLGECAANWTGRASALADGTVPPEAALRREQMAAIWRGRRGKSGEARFAHEKIPPPSE